MVLSYCHLDELVNKIHNTAMHFFLSRLLHANKEKKKQKQTKELVFTQFNRKMSRLNSMRLSSLLEIKLYQYLNRAIRVMKRNFKTIDVHKFCFIATAKESNNQSSVIELCAVSVGSRGERFLCSLTLHS